MKPPERFPPDDPREWLNRARSSLARAKVFVSGADLEDLCFDAQQASEKAIKAVMIGRQRHGHIAHSARRRFRRKVPEVPAHPRPYS